MIWRDVNGNTILVILNNQVFVNRKTALIAYRNTVGDTTEEEFDEMINGLEPVKSVLTLQKKLKELGVNFTPQQMGHLINNREWEN